MFALTPPVRLFFALESTTYDDLNRRGFLGAMAVTGLLSACASRQDPAPPESSATRTVTDMTGRVVEVPTDPQRVVFLNELELAPLVTTLGYVPYGVAANDRKYVERLASLGGPQADLSGIRYAGPNDEFDLEAIAALNPDLVFVDGFDPDQVEAVAAIAPTLAVTPRALPDPLAAQRLVVNVLGLDEAFEERVTAYETRLTEICTSIDVDWSAMTYNIIDQLSPQYGDYIYDLTGESAWWPSVQVLTALGAKPVQSALKATEKEGSLEVSVERLAEYDADVVFMATLDDRPIDPTVLSLMAQTSAARNRQLFQVDANVWSYANGIQGRFDVLDDLEELLKMSPAGRGRILGQFDD